MYMECGICYEPMEGIDKHKCLRGHEFHYSCLSDWLASNDTCPICRGGYESTPRSRRYIGRLGSVSSEEASDSEMDDDIYGDEVYNIGDDNIVNSIYSGNFHGRIKFKNVDDDTEYDVNIPNNGPIGISRIDSVGNEETIDNNQLGSILLEYEEGHFIITELERYFES
jgi:hypothetical protein